MPTPDDRNEMARFYRCDAISQSQSPIPICWQRKGSEPMVFGAHLTQSVYDLLNRRNEQNVLQIRLFNGTRHQVLA
jgi:hypothetical protein